MINPYLMERLVRARVQEEREAREARFASGRKRAEEGDGAASLVATPERRPSSPDRPATPPIPVPEGERRPRIPAATRA